MAMNQWRRFQFFENQLVSEPGEGGPKKDIKNLAVNCVSCFKKSLLIMGDIEGGLHVCDRDLNILNSFLAYTRTITHIEQAKSKALLATVGMDDEETISDTLKLWVSDDKEVQPDKCPPLELKRQIRLNTLSKKVVATSLAVLGDGSIVAVGLVDGTVLIFGGDLFRERQTITHKYVVPGGFPITGLGFVGNARLATLFVTTSTSVVALDLVNFALTRKEFLDRDRGCESGCSVVGHGDELVLGTSEGIFSYNAHGKSGCRLFAGDRKILTWFRNYLIIVEQSPGSKSTTFTIYDDKNRFIAYSSTFQNIAHIAPLNNEFNLLFVLTRDGSAYKIVEKELATKLDTLFRKNLYQVALEIVEYSNQQDKSAYSKADIFKEFGDHLYYDKNDYSSAIQQYIKTIEYGTLEPSYVIKMFLDANNIQNLTLYLKSLHDQGQANPNHTTLLLNCYTKLKDVAKLDEFIKDPDVKFHAETAIRVCRQAGYHQHALDLSQRTASHHWYLKILLENLRRDGEALEYIKGLPFEEAEINMRKYGQMLVSTLPEQTTQFLKELCTDYLPFHMKNSKQANKDRSLKYANPDQFIHIFVSRKRKDVDKWIDLSDWLILFLDYMVEQGMSDSIDHYLGSRDPATRFLQWCQRLQLCASAFLQSSSVTELELLYQSSRPLTDVLLGRATGLVVNTLLELYLRDDETVNIKERRDKAMALLQNPDAEYDEAGALILCQMQDFKSGQLFLLERMGLYNEILQYYVDNNEYTAAIQVCQKYAKTDPNLWIKALSYFADLDPTQVKSAREIMDQILKNIEKTLLPPLQVIQILSQSKHGQLGMITQYVSNSLKQKQDEITECTAKIKAAQAETKKDSQEIKSLTTSVKKFQTHSCERPDCHSNLDLPAYHFFCGHSFHHRCLGENESICPECAEENRNFKNKQQAREENSRKHSDFFRQLDNSTDGFGFIASYFNRGVFDKPVAEPVEAGVLPTLDPGLFKDLEADLGFLLSGTKRSGPK